jgi:hypothetical protein
MEREQDLPEITRVLCRVAREHGVSPALTVAVALVETGLRNVDMPGNPGRGWFQMRTYARPYTTSTRPPTDAEAHDLDYAAGEFCRAAAHVAMADPSVTRDLWRWAVQTQGVGNALHRNRPFAPRNFASYLFEAEGFIAAFDR